MVLAALRRWVVWACLAVLLTGCRFQAESDILSGHPSLPLAATVAALPAARYEEVDGTRAASLEMTPDNLLRVTLLDDAVQKQQVELFALYTVPGPANAVLGAETDPSGRVNYYLFRRYDDGRIDYVDVDSATHDDPRVLLNRAHLWAMGIAQHMQIVDLSQASGSFRPADRSQADFDSALAARGQQRAAEEQRNNRQECLAMMADCPLGNAVCIAEGDGLVINSVDGRFWYSYETGDYIGLSGMGLLGSGRRNCAMEKLLD